MDSYLDARLPAFALQVTSCPVGKDGTTQLVSLLCFLLYTLASRVGVGELRVR